MSKEYLTEIVNTLPDDFQLDELFEQLVLIEKIEKGMQSLLNGRSIPHAQVMADMRKRIAASKVHAND